MNEHELSRGELLQRYGKQLPAAAAGSTRRSPFKFLDSYDADDADIFFGRDEEIEELLRHFHSLSASSLCDIGGWRPPRFWF